MNTKTQQKQIFTQLSAINEQRKKKKINFKQYYEKCLILFNVNPPKITETYKIFIAGFILGEGSINCSAKKDPQAPFGFYLDLEFSVTQHLDRVVHLVSILNIFQTGRIRDKSSSAATMVYNIEARASLLEKVIPFWKQYLVPYLSDYGKERFDVFCLLLNNLDQGKHTVLKSFKEEVLPLWDKLRKQKGQKNQSFAGLQEALDYVDDVVEKKKG